MAHTFKPCTWEARHVELCEFRANLVYRASSRTDKANGHHFLLLSPMGNNTKGLSVLVKLYWMIRTILIQKILKAQRKSHSNVSSQSSKVFSEDLTTLGLQVSPRSAEITHLVYNQHSSGLAPKE